MKRQDFWLLLLACLLLGVYFLTPKVGLVSSVVYGRF
jgi:hypothetical protein